jgi:homoserine dehydrogenase
MKTINIGILGGGQVVSFLIGDLLKLSNIVKIKYILVHDLNKPRYYDKYNLPKTDNIEDVLSDPSVDLIIDCLPGVDLPKQAIIRAITNNKDVISCGKELWCNPNSEEIIQIAHTTNQEILLNSLVANVFHDYTVTNGESLTYKNLRNFPSEHIYANRYAGALETALFIITDVQKIIAKWNQQGDQ